MAAKIEELRDLLGVRLVTSASELLQHGSDESYHRPFPPDAVVYPQSTADVVEIVQWCSRTRTPLIPYGAGTSLEGHIAAVRGGVCLDMTSMDKVLAVNVEDLDVTVQAGVTRSALDRRLRSEGLFFPVDPGADATIGGMTATRASGTTAVRYGTMRDNVLSLQVVLADGRVVRTSRRARKSSAGYDLTRLFVGSEGTLGVITEVTVRVFGVPEAISAAVCPFPSIEAAVNVVIRTIQLSIPVARAELLDKTAVDAVNRRSGTTYPVAPTLCFEFHGTPTAVAEQAETVGELCQAEGVDGFTWASDAEERAALWRARHEAYYAVLALRPGSQGLVTDVCVPISQLARCISETEDDLRSSDLVWTILGHVGDGNFHVVFLVDPDAEGELASARALNQRMVERAIAMDGTCTGEHGVGYGKRPFLRAEHGDGVDVMSAIKRSLDPDGILNPGKIVDLEPMP